MVDIVVDTLSDIVDADDGETSLREAIALANAAPDLDNITFSAGLSGQITLLEGELALSNDVSISGDTDGDGVADITISGDTDGDGVGESRVFIVSNGTADLDALTITGGNASSGGGLYIANGATVNLTNSTLSGNSAAFGGGIANAGTATLTNSTLSGNSAYFGGGINNSGTASLTLTNSTLSGNDATYSGGGIFNNGGTALTLTNSTLSGNTANIEGGGIYNFGTASLTNSTLSGNDAYRGGGIYNFGTASLTNSIVLGNTAANNAEVNGEFTATNTITGANNETAELVFAQLDGTGGGLLADNGGPVQTIALNTDVSNPALDAGDDAAAPATDAAGANRDDYEGAFNNGTNISDLGALEVQVTEAQSLIVTTSDDVVDAFDDVTSLREALALANSDADESIITFDLDADDRTIILGGTELVLSSDVTIDGDIDGDDVADITISGGGLSRVFRATDRTADLDALTITGGSASIGGGVLIASGATVNLTNSTLSGNSAAFGGGIYNYGIATLTNSTLSGNDVGYFGGGISNFGTATLTNSTLSGNSADTGGGISNFGTATLTNSTLSGNSADIGGGISNSGTASLTLTNSTLSGNSAEDGGGISNFGTATLTNSIVLGNTADFDAEVRGTVTPTNSIVGGAEGPTAGNVFAELDGAGGGLLADNGGPVQTIALRADVSNPALDAGDDDAAPEFDASGAARFDIANVGTDGGDISDLGALELQQAEAASLIVTTSADVVDAFDDVTSLREAIAYADSLDGTDTITFDLAVDDRTITLAGTELVLSSDVTIDGDMNSDDVADITISGDTNGDGVGESRVFNVTSGRADLDALTIAGGNAGNAIFGGGVYIALGATVNLTNSTLSGNTADFDGGGISNRGAVTLTNSTLSGNDARYGGGIYNSGTATLTNSTLSGNSANFGGGIYNSGGTATLTNSTLSGNSAGFGGGGIFNRGTATLTNSIVLGNTAVNDAEVFGTVTPTNSIVGGAVGPTAGNVFAELDGAGGLLADNGGPVQTIALKDDVSNPALDAGNDMVAPATDASSAGRYDYRNVANNGTNISDLGALELQQAEVASLIVTTSDDVVDAFDGLTSLREALALANSDADESIITFDLKAGDRTITLGGTELVLSSDVTIDGDMNSDDVADITISGGGESRVFNVTSKTADLDALIITGGYAGNGYSGGGVLIGGEATVNLTNSTLSGNTADFAGGGISNNGTAMLTNSTFSGNTADYGGGIYNYGTATLTNSTLSGNTADSRGGGIFNYRTATLTNSTLSGNTAYNSGGGIYNVFGTASLTNSIVLGNTAGNNAEVNGEFTATNTITGANNETAELVFAQLDGAGGGLLADNGGPVKTIALNTDVSNPALDAGDDAAAVTAGAAADASGAARVDFTDDLADNGNNISDLGALEALLNNQIGNDGDNIIDGNDDSNFMVGNGGADTLNGLGGADDLNGGSGDDMLNGGDGNDVLVDAFGTDTLNGGEDDDILVAFSGANTLLGGGGNDLLKGGIGADNLQGGSGTDVLVGDISNFLFGNDTLAGGFGDDFLQGGGGADVFVFNPNEGTDTIAQLDIDYDDITNTQAVGVDFQVGIDRVDVSSFGYADGAQAYGKVSDNDDGYASFTDDGTTIIFYDVLTADLSADSFIFDNFPIL